ncbi:nitroreductase family protein [Aquabacter spiritensis]|uniref:Putative NAD(P)H nitroreductase n=1 Tax=Aquabacter spiritensis TaxID=933073 RepID=A0A4R3M699_9HYPH|nr:nitroreductase [Aquabacter spiritensis]TCT07789.1 nitroreductase [Aquabacter spiritensis]
MPDAVELLLTRRSTRIIDFVDPGPGPQDLETILTIAARVPDHGKLAPWRFILFEGEGRARAGAALAAALTAADPQAPERRIEEERKRFLRAPLVVAVVSKAAPHPKIPESEQVLSSAAVAQNMLIAAAALGYGATWVTEWPAYEPRARAALGLGVEERVTGFIYIGHATQKLEDRPRPALDAIVTRY